MWKHFKRFLTKINFNLKDRFCDKKDLQSSWEKTDLAEPILLFLAELFEVDKNEIQQANLDFNKINDSDDCVKKTWYQTKLL